MRSEEEYYQRGGGGGGIRGVRTEGPEDKEYQDEKLEEEREEVEEKQLEDEFEGNGGGYVRGGSVPQAIWNNSLPPWGPVQVIWNPIGAMNTIWFIF